MCGTLETTWVSESPDAGAWEAGAAVFTILASSRPILVGLCSISSPSFSALYCASLSAWPAFLAYASLSRLAANNSSMSLSDRFLLAASLSWTSFRSRSRFFLRSSIWSRMRCLSFSSARMRFWNSRDSRASYILCSSSLFFNLRFSEVSSIALALASALLRAASSAFCCFSSSSLMSSILVSCSRSSFLAALLAAKPSSSESRRSPASLSSSSIYLK